MVQLPVGITARPGRRRKGVTGLLRDLHWFIWTRSSRNTHTHTRAPRTHSLEGGKVAEHGLCLGSSPQGLRLLCALVAVSGGCRRLADRVSCLAEGGVGKLEVA